MDKTEKNLSLTLKHLTGVRCFSLAFFREIGSKGEINKV